MKKRYWLLILLLAILSFGFSAPLPEGTTVAYRPVPGAVIGHAGEPRPGGRVHGGTDYAGERGQEIHAAFDGVIIDIRDEGLAGGIVVEILHEGGYRTRYCHMFDPGMGWEMGLNNLPWPDGVYVGAHVKAGDVIGYVGNSGMSRTWHLHFSYIPPRGYNIDAETIEWTDYPEVSVYPYWLRPSMLKLWEINR